MWEELLEYALGRREFNKLSLPRDILTTGGSHLGIVGKAFAAASQADGTLYTMAVLQAYQADLLNDLDQGESLSSGVVSELCIVTDLALCVTKQAARSIGRSIVAMDRHPWLNLSDIKECDKTIVLHAPVSATGLFGTAVKKVVEKFREPRTQ